MCLGLNSGLTNVVLDTQQIVTAFEENDPEAFTLAVRDYDRILKLSDWQTSILFRIKELIQDDDEALT